MLSPITPTQPLLPISEQLKPLVLAPLTPSAQSLLISQYLKASLPQQQDPTRLLATLWQLEQDAGLSAATGKAAREMLASLPDPAQLASAEGVRDSLLGSGLFLEAQLLGQSTAIGQDYKGHLLKLAALISAELGPDILPGSPDTSARAGQIQALARHILLAVDQDMSSKAQLTQLLQDVQGSLARVQTHQLMHLQDPCAPQSQWLLEIPVRAHDGIDVLQLHVERDARQQQHEKATPPTWQITLSFDFPSTGAVMVRLRCSAQAMAITFHAERSSIYAFIDQQRDAFSNLLNSKGLTDVQVLAQRGMPHSDTLPQPLRSQLQVRA